MMILAPSYLHSENFYTGKMTPKDFQKRICYTIKMTSLNQVCGYTYH